jgi:pyruvate kinase
MIERPRPTRAEASDVANAVWDGADAVMLSGETASGRHPLQSVEMMDRIVREAEEHLPPAVAARVPEPGSEAPFNVVTAAAACRAAVEAGARAIACFTLGGTTARLLAHFRPPVPVVAFSTEQSIRRRIALYWGVVPKMMEPIRNPDVMCQEVSDRLVADGLAGPGDKVVLVYGSPLGVPGQTNSIRLHQIPAETSSSPGYRVPI